MKNPNDDYELREEYDLSQLPILPKGRSAPERRAWKNIVVLEPDLAKAFPNDEAVNKALRVVLVQVHANECTKSMRRYNRHSDASRNPGFISGFCSRYCVELYLGSP